LLVPSLDESEQAINESAAPNARTTAKPREREVFIARVTTRCTAGFGDRLEFLVAKRHKRATLHAHTREGHRAIAFFTQIHIGFVVAVDERPEDTPMLLILLIVLLVLALGGGGWGHGRYGAASWSPAGLLVIVLVVLLLTGHLY